jgi:hypothetical protein
MEKPTTTRRLIPSDEARHQWLGGIGRTKFDELMKSRQLVRVHIGRRAFVTVESLESYVASLAEETATEETA